MGHSNLNTVISYCRFLVLLTFWQANRLHHALSWGELYQKNLTKIYFWSEKLLTCLSHKGFFYKKKVAKIGPFWKHFGNLHIVNWVFNFQKGIDWLLIWTHFIITTIILRSESVSVIAPIYSIFFSRNNKALKTKATLFLSSMWLTFANMKLIEHS